MPSTGNPLLVILGPTAVGKTALAIRMAQALGGEIVSADSRQIYREMDIGTAKPTPEQQRGAPHHLIDVVAPDQELSLAQYQRLAYEVIDRIHERGRLPMLVGGTGQYITAVLEGWSIPEVPPNPTLRAELETFADRETALKRSTLACWRSIPPLLGSSSRAICAASSGRSKSASRPGDFSASSGAKIRPATAREPTG